MKATTKNQIITLLIYLAFWGVMLFMTYGCKKESQPDVCQTCVVTYKDQTNGNVITDSTPVVLCNEQRLDAINGSQIVFIDSVGHYFLKQTNCQ